MNKYILWIAVAVIVTVGTFIFSSSPSKPAAPPAKPQEIAGSEVGATVGKQAPAFTLNALNGNPVAIAYKGKVTVINFWATWCPPCREEMPEMDKFAAQYSGTVAFYAVNIQEPASKVSEFMQTHNYKMPVLLDHDGTIGRQFRVSAIPTTVIVDKNGIIKYRKPGGVTFAEIENITKGL